MNIVVLFMLVSYFFVRPSALGQDYSTIGIISAILAFIIYFVFFSKRIKINLISNKNIYVLLINNIFWIYLLGHSWINKSEGILFTLKAFISNLVIIIIFFVLLNDKVINKKFFKALFNIIKFSIISWIITVVISIIIPLESLYIFKLPLQTYDSSGSIYFPFTILYGFMTVGSIKLPRLLSLFRESGIAQMIFIWYIFNLESYNLNTKFNKIILILGTVATFSTSGIFILFFIFALKYLIKNNNFKNYIMALAISLFSIYILFNAPYIGIKNKMITHGESISIRMNMVIRGIDKFIDNPLGIGMYGDLATANSNINLIASMYVIGIIGVIIYITIYIFPIRYMSKNEKINYITSIMSIFITGLLSQPLLDAPGLYIHFFANYENIGEKDESINL